jgi:hypothetical protein
MKILVYVMTHLGDPNDRGVWGCFNCMGNKRSWNYDAVIGVGGVGAESDGFRGKVKWIGKGPHKSAFRVKGMVRHKVTFDHFLDFGTSGPSVPRGLARRMQTARRGLINLTPAQKAEAEKLVRRARNAPPSRARAGRTGEQADSEEACKKLVKKQESERGRFI